MRSVDILVGASALVDPGLVVEIEVDAIVDSAARTGVVANDGVNPGHTES